MIICAAIKFQIEGLDHETVVPCRRHGDAYKIMIDLNYQPKQKYKEIAQGFITHKGEFLDRVEALAHARECGQLSETHRYYQEDQGIRVLYSEDLY